MAHARCAAPRGSQGPSFLVARSSRGETADWRPSALPVALPSHQGVPTGLPAASPCAWRCAPTSVGRSPHAHETQTRSSATLDAPTPDAMCRPLASRSSRFAKGRRAPAALGLRATRSRCNKAHVRRRRHRLAVLQPVSEDAQREHFHGAQRVFLRRSVRHHARQLRHLSQPAAVSLTLEFHRQVHVHNLRPPIVVVQTARLRLSCRLSG